MLSWSTDFSLWYKRWFAGRGRIIVTGECGYSSICWQCCHTIYSSVFCMIHFWSHCLAASCLFYFFRFLFVFFIFLCRVLDGLFCCVFRLIGLVVVFAAFRCFWDGLIAWRRYWRVVGLFAWSRLIDLFLGRLIGVASFGWFVFGWLIFVALLIDLFLGRLIGVASFDWFVFGTAFWRGVVWLICFCDGLLAWRCLIDLFLGRLIGVASFDWFVFVISFVVILMDTRYDNVICFWVKRVVLSRWNYRRQSL